MPRVFAVFFSATKHSSTLWCDHSLRFVDQPNVSAGSKMTQRLTGILLHFLRQDRPSLKCPSVEPFPIEAHTNLRLRALLGSRSGEHDPLPMVEVVVSFLHSCWGEVVVASRHLPGMVKLPSVLASYSCSCSTSGCRLYGTIRRNRAVQDVFGWWLKRSQGTRLLWHNPLLKLHRWWVMFGPPRQSYSCPAQNCSNCPLQWVSTHHTSGRTIKSGHSPGSRAYLLGWLRAHIGFAPVRLRCACFEQSWLCCK